MFGKFVKFTAEIFSECQNVDRVKRSAKDTDVCMFYTLICPEYMQHLSLIYMIIIFNNIINNSHPPAWYFLSDQDRKQGIYNCWPNDKINKSGVVIVYHLIINIKEKNVPLLISLFVMHCHHLGCKQKYSVCCTQLMLSNSMLYKLKINWF